MTRYRLPGWLVRLMLRRDELPDIPEVRHLLRAAWRRGFTFGAAPSPQEMRTLREKAAEAILRAPPDEDAQ